MTRQEFRRMILRELKLPAGRSLHDLAAAENISRDEALAISRDVFHLLCRRAVADSIVTRDEKRFLKRAAERLEVSARDRIRTLRSVSQKHIRRTESDAQVVGGLSTAEWAELNELREAVGLAAATATPEASSEKRSSKRNRLQAARRINRICAGVLAGCTVACGLLIAGLWQTDQLTMSLPALIPLIAGGIVWFLSLAVYVARLNELSSLERKLSFREQVVHIEAKERTEEVAYVQTTYHYHEGSNGRTRRSVADPGYCASTFDYWVDCRNIGRVAVSRRVYFQLEEGQYYLVRISTIGDPEINKVFRSAARTEFQN